MEHAWAMGSSYCKVGRRGEPASLPSTQISGDAPPLFINRCGGLKIGVIALRSTSSRYGAGAQAFHWLTVMLVLAAYVVSKGDPDSLYSAGADGLRRIHETLGVLVFIVVVLRLLWRLIDSTPAKQPMPRWMAAAAKLVQFALYALLAAIPATAVLGTWLLGIPVTLPGFDIAPQIAKAHGLGQLIMELHTTLGNAILWVAGVHAAAALFHHFYLRDQVFQSMAPGG
jgi:cytochrome b561